MVDFGREISCTTELRSGRFVTGVRLVAEAAYRRLTTPRGMLRGGEDEANYGFDLSAYVGSVSVSAAEASLPARIRAELLKDQRIESVETSIEVVVDGPATSFVTTVRAQTAGGPFTLQLDVSAVTTQLLGITS